MNNNTFLSGIIEGFFGTPWKEIDRLQYPKWLKEHNFDFYIYAPKNDSFLRTKWQNQYPKEYLNKLKLFSETCKNDAILPGIGFTPHDATKDLKNSLPLIKQKITQILEASQIDILAILFDDLKIDNENEGYKQNIILQEVMELIPKQPNNKDIKLITCPSFYSFDPILEKVFGKQPATYFKDFVKTFEQEKNFEIFWTGPKVISTEYPKEHLLEAINTLGRKPFIWDNYPVNDGKKISDFMFLSPFTNRENIKNYCSGIAINPMKQANFSKIPLASLHDNLDSSIELNSAQDKKEYLTKAINSANIELENNKQIANLIKEEGLTWESIPLSEWSDNYKTQLLEKLTTIPSCPIKKELLDFINGEYCFDPACLTS